MIKLSATILLLLTCITLTACDSKVQSQKNDPLPTTVKSTPSADKTKQQESIRIFLDAASESFLQLDAANVALQLSTKSFTQSPSPENLKQVQKALQETHHRYMLVQVFQNIDILNTEFDLFQNQPSVIHPLNVRLDQHPMISGYLDAVPDFPASGLIFTEQALSSEFLNHEHQFSDKAYVAIGFHALEFMLAGGLNKTAEERSLEFTRLNGTPNKNTPPLRRSRYVQILASLINDDIIKLTKAWTTTEGFYPQALRKLLPVESNRLIQQAYELEAHTLSKAKEEVTEDHFIATKERNAQIARFLETKTET